DLGHGLDEARLVVPFSEPPPDEPHVLGEIRLIYVAAWPQFLHQLVLTDDVTRALDQQHQSVEHLGGKSDGLARRGQPALSGLQGEAREPIYRVSQRGHGFDRLARPAGSLPEKCHPNGSDRIASVESNFGRPWATQTWGGEG